MQFSLPFPSSETGTHQRAGRRPMATPRSSVAETKHTRSEDQSKTDFKLGKRNGKGNARAANTDYSPRRTERDALTPAQALYRRSIFTRRNHRVRVRADRHSVRLPDRSHRGALRLRAGVAGDKRRAEGAGGSPTAGGQLANGASPHRREKPASGWPFWA